VKILDNSDRETIARPLVCAAVVPDFVGYKWFEAEVANLHRVINLKPVTVNPEVSTRVAHSAFQAVAIRDGELAWEKPERGFQIQPMIEDFPPREWLLSNVKIMRQEGDVPVRLERHTRANALVHRAIQVTPNAQHAYYDEVQLFACRRNELRFVPELRVIARW
jgi:hypothetical protein